MGFVKVAHVDTMEEAREIWSSFLDLSERNREQRVCEVPEKIENGSRIFLADSQSFVLFAGDKFVDTVSGPGIFVYLDMFANREQFEYMKQHNEIFLGMKPEAFADGPLDGAMEGVLFKRQEAGPIPFTFDEATYHDFGRKMDLVLQGSGYFILRHANLLSNYALADFSREKLLERTLPEFSEEEKKQLALDVENAFEKTLGSLSETHLAYEFLPHLSNVVTAFVNEQLYEKWVLGKGIILKTIEFHNFYPAEQCVLALVQFEKAKKAERERAQAAKAQEEDRAVAHYQQNAVSQQQVYGNGGGEQEYTVKTGNCNWAKSPMVIQNGKARLTNKRFIYTMGKLGTLGNALLNTVTGSDMNFEFYLSDIAQLSETKQGIAPTILFTLKNGQQYNCTFTKTMGMGYDTAEWLTQIRLVMQANGLQ